MSTLVPIMTETDWRLPEHRREAFQRFYTFQLKHRSHPGMVYSFLPAIAEAFDLDDDGRAWLVWLNGNTQNAVTSLMLLEAAPRPEDWRKAVDFWNDNFKLLEWDTDRRHQKSKFGEATEKAMDRADVSYLGWALAEDTWEYSKQQPYMGRLSAWSMLEYARILFGPSVIPDIPSWMFEDKSGSQSHRNGTAFVAGHDSVYWEADTADILGIVDELTKFADELLDQADYRNAISDPEASQVEGVAMYDHHPDVSRLTMESVMCTYKSWHKPNRRYPGVYGDMMYNRIKKAEARFGRTFDLLWETRKRDLPEYLRLEDNPGDPGLVPVKQNWYLNTGNPIMMSRDFPDMPNDFELAVRDGEFGERKDPKWTV